MGGIMTDGWWIINLRHFLDEEGHIAPASGPARRLAEFLVAIVAMTSLPESVTPTTYQVRCRRRPGRKPCPGYIVSGIDPEDEVILWICPVCGDKGTIEHWQGTIWDLSKRGNQSH